MDQSWTLGRNRSAVLHEPTKKHLISRLRTDFETVIGPLFVVLRANESVGGQAAVATRNGVLRAPAAQSQRLETLQDLTIALR